MQKLRTTNKIIILISYLVELFLLNYFINFRFQYSISLNLEGFLRVNLVFILLDIIYILSLYNFIYLDKEYNPIIIYRKESNFLTIFTFLPYQILKVIILFFILPKAIFLYSYYYYKIILYELVPILIFYSLYFIFPRRDNLFFKCRKLKEALKYNYSGFYNFIYVHGDYSTFNLKQLSPYKINKKNIYINDNDIKLLRKKGYHVDKFLKKCITCEIYYLKTTDLDVIRKILQKTELEDFKKMYIFVVNNKNQINDESIKAYNEILIVNKNEEIEYVEKLLLEDVYASVSKEELNKKVYEIFKYSDKEAKKLYRKTSITCVPKDKRLFHFYKSAYYNKSPYQSILALFNYSASLIRIISTYYYCKNNHVDFESDINFDLVTDQFTILYNFIDNNISSEDYLYESFKNGKYELNNTDKLLFKQELKYLLDSEIIGEYLDFYKLTEIFRLLRNKVEAHGSMTDKNIYIIWHVVAILTDALNYFLIVNKLNLDISNKYEIIASYIDEDKYKNSLGRYIINYKDMFCFLVTVHKLKRDVVTPDTYINFLTGDASIKIE